jgi:hypothetical protein
MKYRKRLHPFTIQNVRIIKKEALLNLMCTQNWEILKNKFLKF